jgi:hypothetical protein
MAEHAVEHAVEHTMHDFGAALSGLEQAIGLNTHIFHDDDERHAADADHNAERAAAIRDEEHGRAGHLVLSVYSLHTVYQCARVPMHLQLAHSVQVCPCTRA